MARNNGEFDQPDSQPPTGHKSAEPACRGEHVLTAKDAGWRSPSLFVSPASFVTLNPPEPKKRRPAS